MAWQMLKLKRLLKKSKRPISLHGIKSVTLSEQKINIYLDNDNPNRLILYNSDNDKWYELINEIRYK